MSARDRILAAAKRALSGGADAASRAAAADGRLRERRQNAPTPKIGRLEGHARIEHFIAQAEAVHGSVSRLSAIEDLPEALSDALRQRNLPQAIRMGGDPELAALDWSALEVSRGPGRPEEPATLSRAAGGVAETGTLMLLSGPDNPVTLTFLGETHFVALRASTIAANLEGAWERLRASGLDPRTVNLVTGPSRTGDIEQKLELGAHGPVGLHIFLVEDF